MKQKTTLGVVFTLCAALGLGTVQAQDSAKPAVPSAIGHVGKIQVQVLGIKIVEEVSIKEILGFWTNDDKYKAGPGYALAVVSIKVTPSEKTPGRIDIAKAILQGQDGQKYKSMLGSTNRCTGEDEDTCSVPFAVPKDRDKFGSLQVADVTLAIPSKVKAPTSK